MENSESTPSVAPPSALPVVVSSNLQKKENVTPITPKIEELAGSRQELLGRIQNLKQDLQNWRMKLDTQVKVYHDELSELKKSLNTEVEQLRTEFQELRTNLQQQQEDVTSSLRSLGLQDDMGETKEVEVLRNVENNKEIVQDLPKEDNGKET